MRVTREGVEVRLPTVEWHSIHQPIQTTHLWRQVDWADASDAELRRFFSAGRRARRSQFRRCRFCGERVVVEHRFSGHVYDGCASYHLGVTY